MRYKRVVGWVLLAVLVCLLIYAIGLGVLVVVGRRGDAGALARLIPDCLVLFKRLLGDRRVPRSRKVLLLGMLGYLASPIDLVPDVIPVAGQLDDAILVWLVLRVVLRGSGSGLLVERMAFGAGRRSRGADAG